MSNLASSDRPVSTKPWSSGRLLTPAQRERKRYKDRASKRAKQEKDRDSLRGLQNQVAALHEFLQSHSRLGSECSPAVMSPHDSVVPSSDLHTPPHEEPCAIPCSPPSAVAPDAETAPTHREPPLGTWADGQPSTWPSISPSLQESGSCTILEYTDEVLGQSLGLSILDICCNDELNQDAVIRGVLEGWHFIEDRTYSCPLWKVISHIDERVFIHSGILTRLTMLSTILRMLVAVVYESNFGGVPPWYRPRPSQLRFPHRVTVDYFAWPGFRERLVFSNCEILTDRFFKYFASCFRLSWPHSISSAYEIQPGSEFYSYSSTFSQHVVDLSKWTMCRAFFSLFPALEEDMPSENGISSSLAARALDCPWSVLSI